MPNPTRKSKQLHDSATGRRLRLIGITLLITGIILQIFLRYEEIIEEVFMWFFFFFCDILIVIFGIVLIYRGKQFIARSHPARLRSDKHAPVIYLRPFKMDATLKKVIPGTILNIDPDYGISFSTFEEQLAEAVEPIGQLVGLGQPHEALPKPGASRLHATDKKWKQLVEELLKKARLVIIRPGHSDALLWEMKKSFEILQPCQLLFLFYRTSKKEYETILRFFNQSFNLRLPDIRGKGAFIAFDADWKPYILPLTAPYFRRSQYKPWKRLIHHALEPVFRELGVYWSPAPISRLTTSAVVFLGLILLLIIIIVFST